MLSRFCISILAWLFLISSGCQKQNDSKAQAAIARDVEIAAKTNSRNEKLADTVFVVVKADGQKIPFSMQDLKKLPLTTIFADGNPQEGPSIPALLKEVNTNEYQFLAITGREGTNKLQKVEITDQLILDFNNRGSVKLVSPTMKHDERVRDITLIEIH